ncbi:thrombomodulin-like [Megalops cyprinoides]|uniref:thrombomodulin-like n=1 Tax=Megalops cyprinoides TaxID=118141 RepID=UPI0018651439|nr:thrombomodulin-like [Megalops cyprinoides]
MNVFIGVIAVVVSLLRATAKDPQSYTCVLNDCYTAIQDLMDFQTSTHACEEKGGRLMTVRTTESSAAIHNLLFNLSGDFWIGLQLPAGRCSEPASGLLRGYQWTTGDNSTEFTNWKSKETVCSQTCVSVSSDLKWTERPCRHVLSGFLCENNYKSMCGPLTAKPGESVSYSTPTGFKGEGLFSLPPGSVATRSSSRIKHLCAPEGDAWLPSPWSCEVDNGGCDHQCHGTDGIPRCECRDGFQYINGECRDIDECMTFPCEHVCVNKPGGYNCSCFSGYRQTSQDPHKCEIYCGSEKCPAECDVNYELTCACPSGYLLDQRGGVSLCIDIDECDYDGFECDHKCENTFGSFICSCETGFELIDGYRCVSRVFTTQKSDDSVTSSTNYDINRASVRTPETLLGIVIFSLVALLGAQAR